MHLQTLERAARILRRGLSKHGKRGSRTHDDAAEDNVHRLRAIESPVCGYCANLQINFPLQDGKERVRLRCSEGFSPLDLYRGTGPGQQASCSGFSENES